MYKGVPPKEDAVRRATHKDPVPAVALVEHDDVLGPDLPDEIEWHPRTVEWWETWRRSPQAKLMLATDWESLLETALLHTAFWDENTSDTARNNIASELRRRVAAWGATYEDRLKLRMKVTQPDGELGQNLAEVTSLVDYRSRLQKST